MDCFGSHCRYRSPGGHLLAEIAEQHDCNSPETTSSDHFRAGFAAACIARTGYNRTGYTASREYASGKSARFRPGNPCGSCRSGSGEPAVVTSPLAQAGFASSQE